MLAQEEVSRIEFPECWMVLKGKGNRMLLHWPGELDRGLEQWAQPQGDGQTQGVRTQG